MGAIIGIRRPYFQEEDDDQAPSIAIPAPEDQTAQAIQVQNPDEVAAPRTQAQAIQTDASNEAPPSQAPAITGPGIPTPHKSAIASLWTKADNIHNPVLRVLGKFGVGAARAIDIGSAIAAPGVNAMIPGTELNTDIQNITDRNQWLQNQKLNLEKQEKQSEATERTAHTNLYNQQAAEAGKTKPKEENWGEFAGWTDNDGTPLIREQNSGQVVRASDKKPPSGFKQTKQPDEPAVVDDRKYQDIRQKIELKQSVTPEELAWSHAYEKRKLLAPAASAALQQPNKDSARLDKSYELNSKQLETTAKPVDDAIARMGRLQETMNQHSPQADALVAPELLTIMAGGAGSGLRMNEAEIARVVGGRSAWENLKGSLQHWSTNPDDARSITPDQDRQIRTLVDAVHSKLVKKQAIIDQARQDLIESDDVKTHRQIVTKAKHDIDTIDAPESEGGGTQRFTDNGVTYNIPLAKVEAFKKAHPNAR